MTGLRSLSVVETAPSEVNVQSALRAGKVAIWEVDVLTGKVTSTKDINTLVGLPPDYPLTFEEMIAKNVDPNVFDDAVQRAVVDPSFTELTIRVTSSDNSLKLIHLHFDTIRGPDGRATKIFGVAVDVTNAVADASPDMEAEARFRQLADLAPALIWVSSPTGEMTFVNRRWYDFTGQNEIEAIPGGWQTVIHPDDLRTVMQNGVLAFRKGFGYSTEARMRRHDGQYRWFSIVVEPRRDLTGKVVGFIGINTDIHARRTEDEIIRHQREQLFHLARDAFGVFDRDGVLLSVNPAWTRILGWTESELVGSNFLNLLHPEDVGRAMAELSGYDNGNDSFSFDTRCRTKGGDYRWISWTGVPSRMQFYAVGRDVTLDREAAAALQQTQEALRQSQKLESIGLLTGGVAHDVNNSLTAISSSLSLAESRIKNNDLQQALHFIGIARTSARRTGALAHRLLAFARRQDLDVRPVNVNDILRSMESLLKQTMGESIEVDLDLASDLRTAAADANQFENVLINLAINARDAMSGGGILRVETMNAILDDRFVRDKDGLEAGNYVLLTFSDTGIGMSAEDVDRAFEPFFTTKPYGEGTGLGLPMVYGFVKQLGGFVSISSAKGEGTTVKIYLPESTEILEELPELGEQVPPMGSGEIVLVVEDNPTVRKLSGEILTQLGYSVLMAEDSVAGLEILLSDAKIDLLMSDIMLPGGMNGREMAARALPSRPELPVLFVTGREESPASDVGLQQTIMKPFSLYDIGVKVREMLDRRES